MKSKVFLAAIFIAVLATSATSYSPAAALSSPQRQTAPDDVLSIPTNSVSYDVNGTFYAWVNVTSFKIFATATGFTFNSINITIPEFYIGIRISVAAKNIAFNVTDPSNPSISGNVTVDASLTGRATIYFNQTTPTFQQSFSDHKSHSWYGTWFVPWGTAKNFIIPLPNFDLKPDKPNATTAEPVGIRFTNENLTGSDTSWTVTHTRWDFGKWLQNKVNSTLNDIAGEAMKQLLSHGLPGIAMGFIIPTSVGMVDLWKANATKGTTTIPNVLLMASALVNLLIKYYAVGQGHADGTIPGLPGVVADYQVNVGVDFGMFFSLIVLNDLGNKVLNNYTISELDIQVPENATLTWRKIGVIVYYGSPAHTCDVTGGVARGYWSYPDGEHKLFFVDYGWDGTPDFLTNGTATVAISHPTAAVTGTAFPFTVQLDKTAGGWLYFSLRLPSGTSVNDIVVKRSDGVTVNSTQYWIDPNSHILYVVDDPVYTYTVELIGGAGGNLTNILLIGAAAVVVVVLVLAMILVRRRGAKPSNVVIK